MSFSPTGKLHGFVTSLGFEDVLVSELGLARAALGPRWPGLISTTREWTAPLDPVFARQQLPGASLLRGQSVKDLAEAAYAAIEEVVQSLAPFTVHVFTPDPVAYRSLAGRAALVEAALLALVKERRRRAFRNFLPWPTCPVSYTHLTLPTNREV